jgi:exodeoxyribonuclease VII large subunit
LSSLAAPLSLQSYLKNVARMNEFPTRPFDLSGGDLPSGGNDPAADPPVFSVSQLTGLIKETLESTFPAVWVNGELSDISRPQSGHVYFTLKDANAQIRGVMWRSAASRLRFQLEDGMEVVCCGNLDVYPPRGSYQLVVRQIEPQGVGALQLALRQLQQRLAAEGLFDACHKKPLPRFPKRIALVTSPTGAAIRDFLEVLRRRWKSVDVLVIPVRVQGEGAADEIADGIRTANRLHPRPDVLVVGRGGGSVEDLWCFNEEPVVRAIFQSEIPVVSAVGHEIDVTLSDLAADVRALTPSEAAERVVPSADEIESRLRQLRQRMAASLRSRAAAARSRLESIEQRRVMRRPFDRLHDLARLLDELDARARQALSRHVRHARERLNWLAARTESVSPLAVLSRGYSITEHAADGVPVRSAGSLEVGALIITRYSSGRTTSRVEQVSTADHDLPANETEMRKSPKEHRRD